MLRWKIFRLVKVLKDGEDWKTDGLDLAYADKGVLPW